MLFIYLLGGNRQFLPKAQQILQQIESRGDTLATSVFTLGEVLTGPRRTGHSEIVAAIKLYFESGRIAMLPFDIETADRYSIVRSSFKVSPADAIHLATAATAGVDVFVTNDFRLHSLKIPGISFIVGLDGKVF